ncbi:hypothetical protein TNCV_4027381 [Trichonephila clavipes]|nr:hypothetical protein TNCV_4027381 [Trichonephila clavipes]
MADFSVMMVSVDLQVCEFFTSSGVAEVGTWRCASGCFIHDGAYIHIFRLRCKTTFMLHKLEGGLNVADLLLCLHATPDLNSIYFFFWGHLKLLVCKMLVATFKDLAALIVFNSADGAFTLDLFERIRKFFVHRVWLQFQKIYITMTCLCIPDFEMGCRITPVTITWLCLSHVEVGFEQFL